MTTSMHSCPPPFFRNQAFREMRAAAGQLFLSRHKKRSTATATLGHSAAFRAGRLPRLTLTMEPCQRPQLCGR